MHDTDLRHPASTDFRRAGHLHGARPVTFHKGSQHAQQPQEVEPQRKANLPFTTPLRARRLNAQGTVRGRVVVTGGTGGR